LSLLKFKKPPQNAVVAISIECQNKKSSLKIIPLIIFPSQGQRHNSACGLPPLTRGDPGWWNIYGIAWRWSVEKIHLALASGDSTPRHGAIEDLGKVLVNETRE
jgi:hypothetical protein